MPTALELKDLARTRLLEAKALRDAGLYDGACYLAGYVIEMAFKARICRLLGIAEYLESTEYSCFKTHDLKRLSVLAGLSREIDQQIASSPDFSTNWLLIQSWKETFRYKPIGSNPRANADDIIQALEDNVDGVFTWLNRYW